ncbi:MAG: hypothetical protein ACRC3B_07555 [Bacteroidia bacterium]
MKKVLLFVAAAAMTAFVACGDDAAKLKAIADSLRNDSISKANAAQAMADSIRQDSTNKANEAAAAAQKLADSLRQDSIDKASKKPSGGSKPKAPVIKPDQPKVGKPRGGN